MITNEEFIRRAKKVHKDKYDYSLSKYTLSKNKIKITCKEHGVFSQIARNHLNGSGCPKCARKRISLTTEEFIEKSIKMHGNWYNYSKVNYINHMTKVTITCPEHGDFNQRPNDHLTGYKCAVCANKKKSSDMTLTVESFINKAKKVHGEKYDYSKVNYINNATKIKIICPEHGSFFQTPNNHLHKDGCTQCGRKISLGETKWLTSLNVPNDKEHRQVKLIVNGKKIQVDGFDPKTNTVYEYNGDFWHGNPKKYNRADINTVNKKSYGELYHRTLIREKNILNTGYNLITKWESDE